MLKHFRFLAALLLAVAVAAPLGVHAQTAQLPTTSESSSNPTNCKYYPSGTFRYPVSPSMPVTMPLQCDASGKLITNATGGGGGSLGAQYNTTPPTYTNGAATTLQTDVNGRLLTNGIINQIITQAGYSKITDGTNTAVVDANGRLSTNGITNQIITQAGYSKITDGTNTASISAPNSTSGSTGVNALWANTQGHCQYNTSAITASAGNFYPCQVDTAGNILVKCAAGCGVGQNDQGTNLLAVLCNKSFAVSDTTSGRVQQIAAPVTTGQAIYICGWDFMANGSLTVEWDYGTGTNCATSPTPLTGAYPMNANVGLSRGGGYGAIIFVPANKALCLNLSTGTAVAGSITYAIF